jgi:hypothetical protein
VFSRWKEVATLAYHVGNTMILYRSGSDDELQLIPPDVAADLHHFLNRRRHDLGQKSSHFSYPISSRFGSDWATKLL